MCMYWHNVDNLRFKSDMTILGEIALCSLRHDRPSFGLFGNPTLKVSKVHSQIVTQSSKQKRESERERRGKQ